MPDNLYRNLGTTGLACHPLGFGCYRINQGNQEHEAALRAYLNQQGNLIDTSANYTDGLSEMLVGQVLHNYAREKVIVVTKGGYIQGQNMELAQKYKFPEIVYYGDGIWHCIHPDFLKTQVQRSLDRMRLKKIDVYLLHQLVNSLFEQISRHLAVNEQKSSDAVRSELYRAGYPTTDESLSRMAMNVLINLPGLDCVLNGMRRLEYVEDAMGTVDLPPVDGLDILSGFRIQHSAFSGQ